MGALLKRFSIHSLIPDLVDQKGHLYHYHLSLKEVADKLGLKHSGWVSRDCKISPLPEEWNKYFTFKNPFHISIRSYFLRWKEYNSLFSSEGNACRLFFLDSFNTSELILVATAFLCSRNKKDLLCLLFRYSPGQLRFKGTVHEFICKWIKGRLKKRFGLFTDSSLIVEEWKNFPLSLIPIPHTVEGLSPAQEEPIFCWWPGEPRASKGLEKMTYLLNLQDPSKDHFHFYVSEEAPFAPSSFLTYLPGILPRDEYFSLFLKCRVILLPYDSRVYRSSTSGIFVEAICCGCIPLVTEGTWMAAELKKFDLEDCIVEWKDPRFFSFTFDLLKNAAVHSRLQKMRTHYLEYHSVTSFTKVLQKFLSNSQSD